MAFVITDPCLETKGRRMRGRVSSRLLAPAQGRARVRSRDDALHSSRGVHRLRSVRASIATGLEAMAAGEAIVKAHIAAHPELMGIPAKERAAAHT